MMNLTYLVFFDVIADITQLHYSRKRYIYSAASLLKTLTEEQRSFDVCSL